ncbi:uncharacterized protein EDB91DRAFT_1093789 [Suillus paluster]|uniref:uncharacterized protein n=1 Tax=Suillus paluster TaxID=48578 RepID=UPI001B860BCD|nr:uncharacterized protein EDB91DRAFT_1093789 [Suillus paluster]KAG1756650.1 hypothetical protein EDB91DRAFT_1093789 [Suillus paluster]
MLRHRDFSAWIVSEGQQIPVYLVAVDENAHSVSCWIPSEAGKTFSIHWRDEGTGVQSCTFISLDGYVVPGRFLFGDGTASRHGVRTGANTERPFVFSQSQSSGASGQCTKDAGTIMLKVKRVKLEGSKPANPLQNIPDWNSQSHIGEHCVGYGENMETYLQSPTTWQVKPYNRSGKRSYVTFVFRYRSRDWLMAQGIIPNDNSALIVPKNRPAKQRVASAPVAQLVNTLMTPSPSLSPNSNRLDRLSIELKNAFPPVQGRVRPALSLRTVSVKGRGRYDQFPGEGLLDLGPPPNPGRFMQGPDSASQESESTAVDPTELTNEGQKSAAI